MGKLYEACVNGDLKEVKRLLSRGVNPNTINSFIGALSNNHTEVVKLLLEFGANANTPYALYWTSIHNNAELTKLLLEKGANSNIEEAIFRATENGNTEIVKLLENKIKEIGSTFPPTFCCYGKTNCHEVPCEEPSKTLEEVIKDFTKALQSFETFESFSISFKLKDQK
jgi:hypothetical protein